MDPLLHNWLLTVAKPASMILDNGKNIRTDATSYCIQGSLQCIFFYILLLISQSYPMTKRCCVFVEDCTLMSLRLWTQVPLRTTWSASFDISSRWNLEQRKCLSSMDFSVIYFLLLTAVAALGWGLVQLKKSDKMTILNICNLPPYIMLLNLTPSSQMRTFLKWVHKCYSWLNAILFCVIGN